MRGAYIDRRQGSVFPEITSDTASIQSSTLQQITSAIGTALYPSSTGFDTPRSSTINSLVSSTESSDGTTSTPQPSDGNVPTAAPQDNGSGSSGLGGGAIAGIAIAAVLVFALIGGWFFWRRRKRMRGKPTSTEISAHIAGDGGGDGGIPELDTKERPQEMPGSRQVETQELHPTQYTKYAMNGSHELKTESEPAELLSGPDEYTAPAPYHAPQRPAAEMTEMTDTTEATNNSLSSNVEAQRRREMEWLEMEEERMRKRRELLAAQGGAKN
ncbi:uncharacterized protein J4E84_001599 [Alternaria hordeiaustralica]|uniref:uncharacterized protein n=1 Tax=Alternaria hordeiaustralica TaxID=1187925 RepID=UPI0020C5321A|nr:uncharacterized protein J4E84_001599 [Alternaria hordeiaustralica]KAI4694975.1 hypothetical protein J4E84_001599 [Alternaria hordeiaustralica]